MPRRTSELENTNNFSDIKILISDKVTESDKIFICDNLEYLSIETTHSFIADNYNKFAKLKYLNQLILTSSQIDENKYKWINIPNILIYEDHMMISYLAKHRLNSDCKNNNCCIRADSIPQNIKHINIMNVSLLAIPDFFDNLPPNLEFLKITNYNPHYNSLTNLPITMKKLGLTYSMSLANAEINLILEKLKLPYNCHLVIIKELNFTVDFQRPSQIMYELKN